VAAKDTVFREYDIRGVYPAEFDAQFARELGRAFAALVCKQDQKAARVAVSRDCRLSSPILAESLIQGMTESGVGVLDCGLGPSPQLYYTVHARALAGGIQITGSHNPPDHNGFKLMLGRQMLQGAEIQELKKQINSAAASAGTAADAVRYDAAPDYQAAVVSRFSSQMGTRSLRVVVDAGNGVGGIVGAAVLRALGCEVIELFTEPDGNFPNHHPDPTIAANLCALQERVVAEQAALGIAWDGDADRLGVVDEKGKMINADMLAFVYIRDMLDSISHPRVIADVKCSDALFRELPKVGAEVIMVRTGHSLLREKLRELDAQFGGHIFFADAYYGFDDGIYAAARLVQILSRTASALSELLSGVPQMVGTPEVRILCTAAEQEHAICAVKKAFGMYQQVLIDGVRISFPSGWALVRRSNTESALVLRFEAETMEFLDDYRRRINDCIRQSFNQRL